MTRPSSSGGTVQEVAEGEAVLDVLVDHRERGHPGDRRAERQQFVEQTSGGVQVGAVVHGLAEGLLRRGTGVCP
ncbi:hypothetical protein SANTM175S_09589 [Streptomyces antimycoticus]